MRDKSLEAILEGFDTTERKAGGKSRACVSVWMSVEDKARYDELQKKSGRRFSKKVREVIQALIDAAEAKTA